jgi:hypothetical protein
MPTPPKNGSPKKAKNSAQTTSTARKGKDTPEKKNGGNSGRRAAKPGAKKPATKSPTPVEPLDFTEDELLPPDEPLPADEPAAETLRNEAPPVWEQLPGEPHRWFMAFQRFKSAGAARSLLSTYNAILTDKGREKQVRISGAWNEAARKWQWVERAKAWDRYQCQKDEADYEERLRKNRDRALDVAEQMIARAQIMLNFPLVRERVEEETKYSDGTVTKVTVIEPARWNFNTPARLTGSAERVLRLAHDIETRRLLDQIQNMNDSELEEEFGTESEASANAEEESSSVRETATDESAR